MKKTDDEMDKKIPYHNPIYIYIVYIISIIVWTIIIFFFGIPYYTYGFLFWILILLPYIIFIIAILSANTITKHVEDFAFNANILTLGMIVSLPLLNWLIDHYNGDKKKFVQMISLAIIFSMLTLIDVWINVKYLCLLKHIKSSLQTIAIMLMTIAIYIYFVHMQILSI